MIAQPFPVCKGNACVRGFMSPRKSFEELAKINVANLVDYAVRQLHMDDADTVYATNTLLDMLRLTEPSDARRWANTTSIPLSPLSPNSP